MTFDPIETTLNQFFLRESRPNVGFILALSGGPDSMALFHLIRALSKRMPMKWAVAHINHNWRQESTAEAEKLEKLCLDSGIPFYMKKLKGPAKANKEAEARQERYAFFKELKERLGFSIIVLGHQKDDLLENALKRLFEGASFENVGNLSELAYREGLELWRPLLVFEKKEIISWLEQRGYFWFEDATNKDPHFLRTRLKETLIPELEKAFGKGIKESLIQRVEESRNLKVLLEKQTSHLWNQLLEKGLLKDLKLNLTLVESYDKPHIQEALSLGPIETHYIIKKFFKHIGMKISRAEVLMLARLLEDKHQNRAVQVGKSRVHVFRGTLKLLLDDSKKQQRRSYSCPKEPKACSELSGCV